MSTSFFTFFLHRILYKKYNCIKKLSKIKEFVKEERGFKSVNVVTFVTFVTRVNRFWGESEVFLFLSIGSKGWIFHLMRIIFFCSMKFPAWRW
jgi:hypothetical protein